MALAVWPALLRPVATRAPVGPAFLSRVLVQRQTVWAPAASFIGTIRDDGCTYVVGAVEHMLAPDGTAAHRLVQPPGVKLLRLPDLVPKGSESLRDAPPLPLDALPMAPPQPTRGTVIQ